MKPEISVGTEKESLTKPVDKLFSGMYSHCKTRCQCGDMQFWTSKEVIEFLH